MTSRIRRPLSPTPTRSASAIDDHSSEGGSSDEETWIGGKDYTADQPQIREGTGETLNGVAVYAAEDKLAPVFSAAADAGAKAEEVARIIAAAVTPVSPVPVLR